MDDADPGLAVCRPKRPIGRRGRSTGGTGPMRADMRQFSIWQVGEAMEPACLPTTAPRVPCEASWDSFSGAEVAGGESFDI